MKAIAIVELPDDAFDKGKWYLDKIYYTEKESMFDDYALEMWELKPLPSKMIPEMVIGNKFAEGCVQGWNDCLDEISKERKEAKSLIRNEKDSVSNEGETE